MVGFYRISSEKTDFTYCSHAIYSQLCTDMLAELSRREKEANIKPDPDIDMYMKVKGC